MDRVVLEFVREKVTKNTVRFKEVERAGHPVVVGSLYVTKSVAANVEYVSVVISERDGSQGDE